MDALIRSDSAQIIAQRLALVPETELDELEEFGLVRDSQGRAFARQRHLHKSGRNFRGRAKSARRNFQRELRLRIELARGGKISVFATARARHDSLGDFELHHYVNRGDLSGTTEQLMKNRRRDVVGQIAVHAEFAAGQLREIELEHVARDDFNAGPFVGLSAHDFLQVRG